MELRQIHYFIAVAETASLTRAVERLHIAQPALSQNIRKLEEELGARLFERSRIGMTLTDRGAAFLEHARGIIRQVNRAKESVRNFDETPAGSVSIAMPGSVANVLSVPLFQLLGAHYPKIDLNLDEGLNANVRQAFDMGLFDIILEFDAVESDTVTLEPLIREELYFISQYSDENPAAQDIEFRELENYSIILSQVQHAIGRTVTTYARDQQVELNIVPSTPSMHPAIKLFEAGLGCGILPWSAIYEKHAQKTIDARKIINPSMHRMVSMVCPVNRPRTIATSKVHELVRMAVKQVHAQGKWRGELMFD